MYECDEELLTPEERMERIADILAQGMLRLIDDEKNGVVQKQKQIESEIVKGKPAITRKKKQATEEFINTNDVVRIFKISRTTLWRLRKQKEIYCR